ncbi:uncharacterized protein LOC131939007 [Physella acuta]|uniref:uncharacterized protein LOC131939007 n=1 Tax=Physella acuta TaxID=109671 RepID=UPI0027DD6EA2|nr:uncharacterized protein LOC131939007 [Physella acuta]
MARFRKTLIASTVSRVRNVFRPSTGLNNELYRTVPSGLNCIDQIPQELLLNIFSYLDKNTLLRLMCVCKHWRKLILTSPKLWRNKHLKLACSRPSLYNKRAYSYAKRFGSYVQRLNITCEHPNRHACKFMAICLRKLLLSLRHPSLTSLKITDLRLDNSGGGVTLVSLSQVMTRILSSMDKLQDFHMTSSLWPLQEGLRVILTVLSVFRGTLRSLVIDRFFSDDSILQPSTVVDQLTRGILALPRLAKLGVDYFLVTDDFVTALSKSHAGQLKVLKLTVKDLNPRTPKILKTTWVQLKKACPSLKVAFQIDGWVISPSVAIPAILDPVLPIYKIRLMIGSKFVLLDTDKLKMATVLQHITTSFSQSLVKFEMEVDNYIDPIDASFKRLVQNCRHLIRVKVWAFFSGQHTRRLVLGHIQARKLQHKIKTFLEKTNKRPRLNPPDGPGSRTTMTGSVQAGPSRLTVPGSRTVMTRSDRTQNMGAGPSRLTDPGSRTTTAATDRTQNMQAGPSHLTVPGSSTAMTASIGLQNMGAGPSRLTDPGSRTTTAATDRTQNMQAGPSWLTVSDSRTAMTASDRTQNMGAGPSHLTVPGSRTIASTDRTQNMQAGPSGLTVPGLRTAMTSSIGPQNMQAGPSRFTVLSSRSTMMATVRPPNMQAGPSHLTVPGSRTAMTASIGLQNMGAGPSRLTDPGLRTTRTARIGPQNMQAGPSQLTVPGSRTIASTDRTQNMQAGPSGLTVPGLRTAMTSSIGPQNMQAGPSRFTVLSSRSTMMATVRPPNMQAGPSGLTVPGLRTTESTDRTQIMGAGPSGLTVTGLRTAMTASIGTPNMQAGSSGLTVPGSRTTESTDRTQIMQAGPSGLTVPGSRTTESTDRTQIMQAGPSGLTVPGSRTTMTASIGPPNMQAGPSRLRDPGSRTTESTDRTHNMPAGPSGLTVPGYRTAMTSSTPTQNGTTKEAGPR